MKTFFKQALWVLLLGMMPYLGYADIPGIMTYQGYLSDASNKPIDGTIDITFSIPGTTWTETHTGVQVKQGLFGILLGSKTLLTEVDFSQPRSLQIEYGGNSLTVPFTVVPYAIHAKTVDQMTLASLACGTKVSVAKWDGSQWVCADWNSLKGEKGDKGDTGTTGPRGATGAMGPRGSQGAIGAMGPIGPQGPKGDIGSRGSQGPTGLQGPKGDIGPRGPQGPTGPQGPQLVIESGYIERGYHNSSSWDLDSGFGSRYHKVPVYFQKRFIQKPQVVLGLSFIDVDNDQNTRINIYAEDITTNGFVLVFRTWSNTIFWVAAASWIAYGYR